MVFYIKVYMKQRYWIPLCEKNCTHWHLSLLDKQLWKRNSQYKHSQWIICFSSSNSHILNIYEMLLKMTCFVGEKLHYPTVLFEFVVCNIVHWTSTCFGCRCCFLEWLLWMNAEKTAWLCFNNETRQLLVDFRKWEKWWVSNSVHSL